MFTNYVIKTFSNLNGFYTFLSKSCSKQNKHIFFLLLLYLYSLQNKVMKSDHQEIFSTIIGQKLPYDFGIAVVKVDQTLALRHRLLQNSVTYYSFTLVLKGEAVISLDGTEIRLRPNGMFICPPGIHFKMESASENYEAITLVAEENFTLGITEVRNVIRAAYFPIMLKKGGMTSLTDDGAVLIKSRMLEIFRYFYGENQTYRGESLRLLFALFILDILNIQNVLWIGKRSFTDRTANIIVDFIHLLHQHYRDHHDIPFYASRLSVTPIYLSRVIKKLTGRTVMNFINRMLQIDASIMLANSDIPIARIAETLNFANPASFCKFFVRETGLSPREYRKNYLK